MGPKRIVRPTVPHPPLDGVPYFPYRLGPAREPGWYETSNHLRSTPVRLTTDAAEVLRLADGTRSFARIVGSIAERYPNAGGEKEIRPKVTEFLCTLAADELVWWRREPLRTRTVLPPTSIFWEITAACNLQCLHCVVAAGRKAPAELSTERCLELASELAAFGVQSVAFSGGEPLVHPDFRRIAERVRGEGMSIQLATNGTLISADLAAWIRELNAEIQVSLDGSTPEIHDRMRPGRHGFDRAVDGVRALIAAGNPVTIGMVVSTLNVDNVTDVLELARSLGAAQFRLIPFVPKGRGAAHAALEVSTDVMRRVIEELRARRPSAGLEIMELEFERMLDGGCLESLDGRLGCHGAVAYGTVTPTGEVLPCHFFEGVRAESVASASFADVWTRSRFLNYFRQLSVSDLHGRCQDCSFLPNCGGGCRAGNFAKGDLFGENRQCWIQWDEDKRGE